MNDATLFLRWAGWLLALGCLSAILVVFTGGWVASWGGDAVSGVYGMLLGVVSLIGAYVLTDA